MKKIYGNLAWLKPIYKRVFFNRKSKIISRQPLYQETQDVPNTKYQKAPVVDV